jgi:hypothetical protein
LVFERATGQTMYLCGAPGATDREMPSDIVRCSYFEDKALPELYDLKELGWRLEKDKNGKVKGFQPPKEDA